ncbi:unnamed protein product [Amoebophrya sp. A120]|nr:unnamed protein product [Amoebophrya sp. A120]|eukprot:GSA120T00011357001.1
MASVLSPDGKSKVPATTAPFGTAPPTNADDATSFGFAARLRQIFGQKKTTCLLAKTLLESLAIALVCIGPIVLFLFTDHVEDFLGSVPGILRQRHLWDADSNSGSTEDAGFASWWTLPTCVVVFVVYSAYLRSGRADFVAKVNEGVKLD